MKDRITAVIATWSGRNELYLQETIESIREQGIEPVVVDDERVAGDKWDEALATCETEYLALPHHDDIYLPGFYEKTIEYLDSHPESAAVFTMDYLVDEKLNRTGMSGLPIPPQESYNLKDLLNAIAKFGNFLRCPSVVFRTSMCKDYRFLTEEAKTAGDLAMWFRIAKDHPIGIINEPLYMYREHTGSDTARRIMKGTLTSEDHIFAMIYGASLDRDAVEWDTRIRVAIGERFREMKMGEKAVEKTIEEAKSFHFHVVHEAPDNAGTGILVSQRVREGNRDAKEEAHIYIFPDPGSSLEEPVYINGVPAIPCFPARLPALVKKYRPSTISYHHLLRWPLSILEIPTQAKKVMYLHDSYLWCAMWHSFDGSNVCNEPEPYKCERCKGYDKDGIPVMPAGEIKRQKEYLQHIGLPKMDRIVANSDYTAENFEKQFGIKPEVENPVPPPLAYYQKRKVFGYFGGFYPVKGVFVLLDAWARTTGGTLLMFCNAPNDMYEKGAIDGSVLSGYDTVLFMGSYRRSNMPHLLSLVDCVICPSINESYGLVSRECEMLGVPYIATHTGGQTNGSIPPNDPAALAVAIQEVIDA